MANNIYGTNEKDFEKQIAEIERRLGRKLSEEEKNEMRKTTE